MRPPQPDVRLPRHGHHSSTACVGRRGNRFHHFAWGTHTTGDGWKVSKRRAGLRKRHHQRLANGRKLRTSTSPCTERGIVVRPSHVALGSDMFVICLRPSLTVFAMLLGEWEVRLHFKCLRTEQDLSFTWLFADNKPCRLSCATSARN